MKNLLFLFLFSVLAIISYGQAQKTADLTVFTNQGKFIIDKHIYGHFSEHLGRCIYGGIWVGEDSKLPNIQGYRKDVFDALKKLNIPNLRWPGGCFADEYHWMDGIGPRADRPKMINTHWGGVVEDNSFGTHEFLNFCKLLGTEPYICGNLGSGSVEEMSDWVEYVNFDGQSPMSNLRAKNGDEKPWGVKYWGVGNENWGCGGNMTPEFYADQYRRYATYARSYGENRLYRIAGGANSWDVRWTEVLMKNIPYNLIQGISLHYYTVPGSWSQKGSATEFVEKDYFATVKKAADMNNLLDQHIAAMNKFDKGNRVALIVDEWGNWFDVEPGTNPGFLYQQNTMRDAITAGLTLNSFNNHAERVKMANIAQMINVLQAIILTDETRIVLTPTYHVFDLYQPHKDATLLPYNLNGPSYSVDGESLDAVSVSCSVDKNGKVSITLVNLDPNNDIKINCRTDGKEAKKVTGKYITSSKITDYNSFDAASVVTIKEFSGAKISKGMIETVLPSKSVVLLQIE